MKVYRSNKGKNKERKLKEEKKLDDIILRKK